MGKLKIEDKIDIYKKKKSGMVISSIASYYHLNIATIKYLVRLIDKHGYEILREKNNSYPVELKLEAIKRVLENNESETSVSIDIGLLSKGTLSSWIKKYKENGYNIVERKRVRSTMPKVTKKKENETVEEENKRLKEENEYLKAELEYTKKLRAVVQARKNQQQKKK